MGTIWRSIGAVPTGHLPGFHRSQSQLGYQRGVLRRRTITSSTLSSPCGFGVARRPHTWTSAAADSAGSTPSAAASTISDDTTTNGTPSLSTSEQPAKAAHRAARLETTLTIRKLYRNLLRAESLLKLPSPVYVPSEEAPGMFDPNTATTADVALASAAEAELQLRIDEAVILVAEMDLTAEELRLGLRALKASPQRYGTVFKGDGAAEEYEKRIQEQVRDIYAQLIERVSKELLTLPFSSIAAAQAAIDSRNARFRAPWSPPTLESGAASDSEREGAPEGAYLAPEARRGLSERLEEAERVAERFVAKRLQAVARVRQTSPEGLLEGLAEGATWARDVWSRLNGAGSDAGARATPFGLPLPAAAENERTAAIDALHGEIEELEKKLQDASKARETRLRKAGIQGRARMAAELRHMDNEVAAVSRALAVRTLQLEMEFIYGCLEGEALDILGDPSAAVDEVGADKKALALMRRGSTDEVALLAAEFRQLDAELAAAAAEVETGGALFIEDGELAALATEIPDLRLRLGVGDTAVFGGQGVSLVKMQMQLRQAVLKVIEAVNFGVRGVRLLGVDVGAAGGLFWRALVGGTLKPREVAALRRTARDVLTFIPFTVILILPLSPVGHVLVFGFIQRYFPGFFPSQFTSRRQDLMVKYEALKRQLQQAQLEAEAENDELEFKRAIAAAAAELSQKKTAGVSSGAADVVSSEAVVDAAVTASGGAGNGGSTLLVAQGQEGGHDEDEESEGPAAAAFRKLQEELAAAADSSYTEDAE